jgi:hypothetical protein
MTMKVIEVISNEELRLEVNRSQIRKSALPHRDYQIPREELEVVASINRGFVGSGTPMYQQINPLAAYAVGDQVAVMEVIISKQPAKMAPNLGDDPANIDRFIQDPQEFYEKGPEELIREAKHVVIGRWRGAAPITLDTNSINY